MSTQFITLLPPPGPSVLSYTRSTSSLPPSTTPSPPIPQPFKEAMSIREAVFVTEQCVPLENELDADDPRSWHWIVYASVSGPKPDTGDDEEEPQPQQAQQQQQEQGQGQDSGARDHHQKASSPPRRKSETGKLPVGTIRLVPPPHAPHPASGSEHKIDNAEGLSSSPPLSTTKSHTQTTSPTPTPTLTTAPSLHNGKEPYVKLGRLATLKAYRGLGLGTLLVNTALEWAGRNKESVQMGPGDAVERERVEGVEGSAGAWKGLVLVHAQTHLEGYYAGLGFVRDEGMGEWWEEGIMHVGMWRRLDVG